MNRIFLVLLFLISLNTAVFAQKEGFYEDIMTLSNVLNHVRTNYVEETNTTRLMNAAINGLLSSLDPHTIYLDSKSYQKFLSISKGKAFGIGVAFEIIDGFPTVITVLPGSPASESKIEAGDILLKVNGHSIINIAEPELKLLLSGEKGSEVRLTFKDYISDKEFVVTLRRDEIPLQSIKYYFLVGSNTGYVKIDHFSQTTTKELQSVLEELNKRQMKSLILDLRGNPGGLLTVAVQVADMFIPEGKVILSTKGRKKDADDIYYSSDKNKQPLYPMIVLINRSSASASEVVAGALQEHDRAVLIGTNSFGKGLVQGTFLLNNGGAILMTISKYFTPTGRLIQREYKNKTFNEYYEEIFNTDINNYKNRPQCKTKAGRIIYGGGGIVPDIFIETESSPFLNWSEIKESNIIYKFANEYVKNNKNKLDEFESLSDYTVNFSIDDLTIDDLMHTISSEGFDTCSTIEGCRDYLKRVLKKEIARFQWDLKASFYVSLNADLQFRKAIEYIPRIKEILR